MRLTGRSISPGSASGVALVSSAGISFFGGVNPDTGVVEEKGHPLQGQCIAGKVLVFPSGKGSTVGSYTLYRLMKNQLAPAAIINRECETITAVGCIISGIACVDKIDLDMIHTGDRITLDATSGYVDIHTETLE